MITWQLAEDTELLRTCTRPIEVATAAIEALKQPGEAILLPTGAKLLWWDGAFRIVGYACDGSDVLRLWPTLDRPQ